MVVVVYFLLALVGFGAGHNFVVVILYGSDVGLIYGAVVMAIVL